MTKSSVFKATKSCKISFEVAFSAWLDHERCHLCFLRKYNHLRPRTYDIHIRHCVLTILWYGISFWPTARQNKYIHYYKYGIHYYEPIKCLGFTDCVFYPDDISARHFRRYFSILAEARYDLIWPLEAARNGRQEDFLSIYSMQYSDLPRVHFSIACMFQSWVQHVNCLNAWLRFRWRHKCPSHRNRAKSSSSGYVESSWKVSIFCEYSSVFSLMVCFWHVRIT